jgi:hypothetical protein
VTNYAEVSLWSLDPDDPGENPDIFEGTTNVFYPTNMYGWDFWMTEWGLVPENRIRTYSNFTNMLVEGYSTNGLVTNGLPRITSPYLVGVDGWVELYTNVVEYSITNIVPAKILKVQYDSYTGPAGSPYLDGTSPYPNTYLWTNSWIRGQNDLVLTNYAVTNIHAYFQTNLSVKLVHWQREYLVDDRLISTAYMKTWTLSQEQKFTKHYYVYLRYLDPLMKWDLTDGLKRK